MKHIKTYERFYEPTYSVTLLNQTDFGDLTNNINNLDKSIEFFNYNDSECSNKPIYFSLFSDDYLVGVCKLDVVNDIEFKKYPDVDYIICYVSIDEKHKNRKLARILIEYVMDWLKENNYSLCTTTWTHDGDTKLRPLVKSIASDKDVIFYDRKTFSDY